MTTCYIVAEYCSADCYMGWWLYERDRNDGSPNEVCRDSGAWGWLKSTASWSPQQHVAELCQRMGHSPPAVQRYCQDFAEWFAYTFPNGMRVQIVDGEQRYELLEICLTRPPHSAEMRHTRNYRREPQRA